MLWWKKILFHLIVLLYTQVLLADDNIHREFFNEKISINFQDIEIKGVLKVLFDISGYNFIATDVVKGKVSMKIDNIPWQEALNIILETKNLHAEWRSNIVYIDKLEERQKAFVNNLERNRDIETLTPPQYAMFELKYAKASDWEDKVKHLLSSKGYVISDERTNTLILYDTESVLEDIKHFIDELDKPVRQVLIETQIIETTENSQDLLGTRFGGAFQCGFHGLKFGLGNTHTKARDILDRGYEAMPAYSSSPTAPVHETNLFVDLPSGALGQQSALLSQAGFAIGGLPGGTLIDLELRALESETQSKIIGRPKIVTMDKVMATVEQGQEIPFTVIQPEGGSTIEFREALLRLSVRPHISPDNKILLDLIINRDAAASDTQGPRINTKSIETTVLVGNSETIVLGGIYDQVASTVNHQVPFLGELPIIGCLFRSKAILNSKTEVLIFVTPKILL